MITTGTLAILGAVSTPQLQTRDVEFRVETPDGHAVENAFIEASRPGPGHASGNTSEDGSVTLNLSSGKTLHVHVSKDGYYATSGEIWTGGVYKGPAGNMIAREIPDRFIITLKPILDPVPLKVTRFRGRAPATGEPVGFDMEYGEWVAPFGKGKTTDVLFHFTDLRSGPDGFKGTMKLIFPNAGDGIQAFTAARPYSMEFGSNLAPPHKAPEDGYQPTLTRVIEHTPGEPFASLSQPGRNYLFRTRTHLDGGGRIRQACYGWIEGEIEFDPRDPAGPQLQFTAAFNPDPNPRSRSLEPLRQATGRAHKP